MRIAKIRRSMRQLFDASRSWPRGRQSGPFLGHACTSSSRSSLIDASTHRRPPLPRALDQVDAWLESPTLTLLTESAAHWPTLHRLLSDGRITGAQVHDARVAALCRQHGVRELWSADRDFSRFNGLAVVNPLIHAS
jgi:predicted nucleic acid-binding protein